MTAQGPGRSWYAQALRLRHLRLSPWQRGVLAEGSLVVASVLVLGELASAWLLLVLPVSVAVVVKAHDLLAGALATQTAPAPEGSRRRRTL